MPMPQYLDLGQAATIGEFLERVVGKQDSPHQSWMFRGHREVSWNPLPQIDRSPYYEYRTREGVDRKAHEDQLLTDFMNAARPHVGLEPKNKWEWLALAQHHGLATRLLDWTANPLAALYFAVEEFESESGGAVWCYSHTGESWISCLEAGPFESEDITEFRPPHITPRITVQGGCFTAHPERPRSEMQDWPGDLRRIAIDRESRERLRLDLARLGIDRAALFPDLDGIAFALNRQHSQGPSR